MFIYIVILLLSWVMYIVMLDLPGAYGEIADCIEVGLHYFLVAEYFVTECV
jgi:hypothetical protein